MIKNIVGYVTKILNQQSVAENVKKMGTRTWFVKKMISLKVIFIKQATLGGLAQIQNNLYTQKKHCSFKPKFSNNSFGYDCQPISE